VGNDLSQAWSPDYIPTHMQTLRRRAMATGVPVDSLIKVLVNFATAAQLENVHPRRHIPAQASFGLRSGPAARARLRLLARFGGTRSANMPSLLQRSRASFCSSLSSRAMQLLECTRIPHSRLVTTRRRRSIYHWRASRGQAFEEDRSADWSRSGCLKHERQDKLSSISAARGS
jgi:hypothetical protein